MSVTKLTKWGGETRLLGKSGLGVMRAYEARDQHEFSPTKYSIPCVRYILVRSRSWPLEFPGPILFRQGWNACGWGQRWGQELTSSIALSTPGTERPEVVLPGLENQGMVR